jgi:hypothetical protein
LIGNTDPRNTFYRNAIDAVTRPRDARSTSKNPGVHMADGQQSDDEATVTERRNRSPVVPDPRDTGHPTGARQAAENAESDSPS